MKKSQIAITLLCISTALFSKSVAVVSPSELSWVDEQVKAIKPPRSGARNSYLGSVKNPFVFLIKRDTKTKGKNAKKVVSSAKTTTTPTPKVQEKKKLLSLEAIMNKSALIDGRWYKEGQSIYGYKLEKVNGKNVLLKSNEKSVVLTTKSKRSLKFNNN
jgi:hypothetical protein